MGFIEEFFFNQPHNNNDFPISFLDAIVFLTLWTCLHIGRSLQEEEDRKNGVVRPKISLQYRPVNRVHYEPVWVTEPAKPLLSPTETKPTLPPSQQTSSSWPALPPSQPTQPTPSSWPALPPSQSTQPTPSSWPALPPSQPTSPRQPRAYYCSDRRGYFLNK